MMVRENSSLCRICLSYGATIPLFEDTCKLEDSTHYKLSSCVSEKVEDLEGYPHNICTSCNTTLQLIFTFTNKYKQTQKILQNSITKVKKESINKSFDSSQENIDISELDNIKTEADDFDNDLVSDSDIEDTLPLKDIQINKKSRKKQTILKTKLQNGSKKNKIASAILEGEFSWNGKQWCMKNGQTLKKLKTEKPAEKEPKEKPIPETKTDKTKPKSSEPKLCDLCGQTFKDSGQLSKHKEQTHNKNPMQCPHCPKILSSAQNVTQHIKRSHGTKNLSCPTCSKAFSYKGLLNLHIKNVHYKHLRPKRTWSCQYCGKVYKCPKSMLVHERSVHTGERPAVCTVCDATFYHEEYLTQHMRLHTGETPFKCPICGRGYAQSGNMKSHLRNHKKSEIDPDVLSKLRQSHLKRLKS